MESERFGDFPAAGFGGTEERVNDRHVADGVFQGIRDFLVFANGLREKISLNRVLIADGKGFGDRATAGVEVLAVVDEDARRLVRRGVERNFDVDAAFGAEELHLLVVHELCAGCEDALTGGEFENRRREAIGFETGVALDAGKDALRLIAKDETRGLHRVAADVHQRAAIIIRNITRVRGVHIEITEKAASRTKLADASGADKFARAQPLRMRAHHKGFTNLHAVFDTGLKQAAGLRGIAADGLFTQDVLDVAGGAEGPLDVHMIGQRIVNGLDLAICQEFLVGAIGFGNRKLCGDIFRLFDGARSDGGDFRPFALLHGGDDLARGDVRGAQNSPFDFRRHDPALLTITKRARVQMTGVTNNVVIAPGALVEPGNATRDGYIRLPPGANGRQVG